MLQEGDLQLLFDVDFLDPRSPPLDHNEHRSCRLGGDGAQFGVPNALADLIQRHGDTRPVRPLTATFAPSAARTVAIANPIPAVEPDTTAALPHSPRSILSPIDIEN